MIALIRSAIERPVGVLAFIVGIVMFGYLALTTIPIQMSPDIEKPISHGQAPRQLMLIERS